MNIAIVIERFIPGAGGNERSTEQIARRLVDRGHSVTILTSVGPEQSVGDALPGAAIEVRKGLSTKTAGGLIEFVRWTDRRLDSGDFDVSLSVTSAVAASVMQPRGGTVRQTLARNIAMRAKPLKRITKSIAVALSPKHRALLWAERRALRSPRTKRIAAVSKYVADQLFHHYTMPSRMIEVIPNAAEIERWDESDRLRTRRRTRQTLGLDDNDVAFVFAAMNPSLKGLPYLREAMRALRADEPRAKLIIAGSMRRATEPTEDGVTWVGPTSRMDALYAAADVTVLPSWYDPSSKVVLESLLHRVPAITTLHNGACQWVLSPSGADDPPSAFDPPSPEALQGRSQRAGRVIDSPANVSALTQAMRELCDDTLRRACSMSCIGIERRISMDVHVDALEKLLHEVAGASGTDATDPS